MSRSRLLGLTSRCTTPRRCAYSSASATCAPTRATLCQYVSLRCLPPGVVSCPGSDTDEPDRSGEVPDSGAAGGLGDSPEAWAWVALHSSASAPPGNSPVISDRATTWAEAAPAGGWLPR